jgi:hypothetical protein
MNQDLKTKIEQTLVKWSMPTRQVAIGELIAIFESELANRERVTVTTSVPKIKLKNELSDASEEMLKSILNDELEESEKWEWYGYIRATRDIARFAGVLNDSPVQQRLEKALAQLQNNSSKGEGNVT